jgi:hypothetical protein
MPIHVWKYQNADKRTVHFRGYVSVYRANKRCDYPCEQVRKTKAEALKDAKKLYARIRNTGNDT